MMVSDSVWKNKNFKKDDRDRARVERKLELNQFYGSPLDLALFCGPLRHLIFVLTSIRNQARDSKPLKAAERRQGGEWGECPNETLTNLNSDFSKTASIQLNLLCFPRKRRLQLSRAWELNLELEMIWWKLTRRGSRRPRWSEWKSKLWWNSRETKESEECRRMLWRWNSVKRRILRNTNKTIQPHLSMSRAALITWTTSYCKGIWK